jgi:hypothetical protein
VSFLDDAMREAVRADDAARADLSLELSVYEPDARALLDGTLSTIFEGVTIKEILLIKGIKKYEQDWEGEHGYDTYTFTFQFSLEERLFRGVVFLNEREPHAKVSQVNHCSISIKTTTNETGADDWKHVSSKKGIGEVSMAESRLRVSKSNAQ